MYFFNLSLGEFLLLFSATSAVLVALYLLDRSRRRVVVATLRFWSESERPVSTSRRRRIRQWGSLLLQLAAAACLLLAISQLRWGSPDTTSRDHVLILDTSSWMNARVGQETLAAQARRLAQAWLGALPANDRVLVLYADALATPATAFDEDRAHITAAIAAAQPTDSGLDLAQAFDVARRLQARNARRAGEIVFAGAGRVADPSAVGDAPPNLRVLEVKAAPVNVGFRRIGLRHLPGAEGPWIAHVLVRNYGARPLTVDIGMQFSGAPVGSRRLRVDAGADQEAVFEFSTRATGVLEARLRAAGDAFPQDDRVTLELPPLREIRVTVCTSQPELFRPLVAALPGVQTTLRAPARCSVESAGVAIFDRVAPPVPPGVNAVYIQPPAAASPIPLRPGPPELILNRWQTGHPLGAGLRAQDLKLTQASLLAPAPGDQVIAEATAGPLMAAREEPSGRRLAVLGFHPMLSSLKFELATPLLFANLLRWMAPDAFTVWEISAASVGTLNVPLDGMDPAALRVLAADGAELPFSIQNGSLRFFAGAPGAVRVLSGARERVFALTLPAVETQEWTIPETARRGVPRRREAPASSRDLWPWLAAAAALIIAAEWLRYAPKEPPLISKPAGGHAGASASGAPGRAA